MQNRESPEGAAIRRGNQRLLAAFNGAGKPSRAMALNEKAS